MWRDYRDSGRVQVLEVDVWNGGLASVQGFIAAIGATFPVLRNGGYLTGANFYGMNRDNYLVIDENGIVQYASTTIPGGIGGWQDAAVRAALIATLTVGVESETWSRVKGLYR